MQISVEVGSTFNLNLNRFYDVVKTWNYDKPLQMLFALIFIKMQHYFYIKAKLLWLIVELKQ